MQHVHLQFGLDVRQKQHVRFPLPLVELRREVGEDVELRVARLGDVQVVAVLAAPEERLLAGDALQAVGVDVAAVEDRRVLVGEVLADHGDEIDFREERSGHGEIRRRAADAAVDLPERSLEGIEGNTSDDEDGHAVSVLYEMYLPSSGARSCFRSVGGIARAVGEDRELQRVGARAARASRAAAGLIELRRMVWAMAALARR